MTWLRFALDFTEDGLNGFVEEFPETRLISRMSGEGNLYSMAC